jgi:hypothetical protein
MQASLSASYHEPATDSIPGLISFSEATRLTPAKYAESLAWCKANRKPQPRHLLYPRTKGFIATVSQLRKAPHVKAVYDLTITYQTGNKFQVAPSFWDTLAVPGLSAPGPECRRFHVHARRFPMAELPESEVELAAWLEARWVEKGQWLEAKREEWAREAAQNR